MLHNRSELSPYWSSREADTSVRLPSLPCRHPVVEKLMSGAILDLLVASYRSRAQFTFFCGDEPDHLGGYDGQLEVVAVVWSGSSSTVKYPNSAKLPPSTGSHSTPMSFLIRTRPLPPIV